MSKECRTCGSTENKFRPGHKECVPCRVHKDRALKYDITVDELDDLLEIGNCQICNRHVSGKNQHIDHCHSTNIVRGVLCRACNTGLGHFDDDIVLLNRAIKYLNESS